MAGQLLAKEGAGFLMLEYQKSSPSPSLCQQHSQHPCANVQEKKLSDKA